MRRLTWAHPIDVRIIIEIYNLDFRHLFCECLGEFYDKKPKYPLKLKKVAVMLN